MPATDTCIWVGCELEPRGRLSPLEGASHSALHSGLPCLDTEVAGVYSS